VIGRTSASLSARITIPADAANAPNPEPKRLIDLILTNGGRTSDSSAKDTPRPDRLAKTNGRAKPSRHALRFIDLFCGIGGFRLAFERAGARCVFSSDWDKFARQTYAANFGEEPHGDITKIPVESIPPFEILCGGFPCQRGTMIASISEWSL